MSYDKDMSRVADKLDRIDERLDGMSSEQVRQGSVLAEHIRRTAVAEARLDLLHKELAPVKLHVATVAALAKVIGVVGTLVALALGIRNLLT